MTLHTKESTAPTSAQKIFGAVVAEAVVAEIEQPVLLLIAMLVLVLVVGSALGVIYSSFQSRQLFSELQQQSRQAMRLEEEWGRLLLEQSTLAAHGRVEQLAKTQLQMVAPDPSAIIVVKQ